MQISSKKISPKIITAILVFVFVVLIYFVAKNFFINSDTNLTEKSNIYLSATRIGQYIDIIHKENISFESNVNNEILNGSTDFSVSISSSQNVGRSNPFLP